MIEPHFERPGSSAPRERQLAYEATRLATSRASANAGRVIPVQALRAWADSLHTDPELPVPRAR